MTKSKFRGHGIVYKENKWFFEETNLPVEETWKHMPCGYCGKENTKEGHDGCLGTLKGVMNACCGHGEVNEAYIQFLDGECIRGKNAMDVIETLKKEAIV